MRAGRIRYSGVVMLRCRGLVLAAMVAAATPALAGLPGCGDPDVADRALSHFGDAAEQRQYTRRASGFAEPRETARTPYTHPLAPRGFEARYCEGILVLDDGGRLPVYIQVIGRDGDGKRAAEAIETCWQDPRFPRMSIGCAGERAPARR